MGKLDGKVAFVTGANKGIGRGIARGLARQGASLVMTARGASELEEAAAEMQSYGVAVLALANDVTD